MKTFRCPAGRADPTLADLLDPPVTVALAGEYPAVRLEASGGLRLGTARAVAETGVDFIAVGALTHSSPALDLGLDLLGC